MKELIKKYSSKIFTLIKVLITVFIVYYFVTHVNFIDLKNNLFKISISGLIVVILIGHFSIFINALKIKSFLENISIWDIVKINYISFFYGMFVPGSLTKDLFRFMYFKEKGIQKSEIITSLLGDRISGLIVILIYFSIGAYLYPDFFSIISLDFEIINEKNIYIFLSIFFLIIFSVYYFYKIYILKKISILIQVIKSKNIIRKFIKNICFAFIFQFLSIVMFYLTLLSFFGSDNLLVPFNVLFLVIPFITLSGFFPISIQNIGISESLYILFLSVYGVSINNILIISFIGYTVLFSKVLIGYIFFNIYKKKTPLL